MKFDEIKNENFFGWVAPDGTLQLGTLAPDYPTCYAMAKLLAKVKMGKSPDRMLSEGFRIVQIELSASQVGNAEEAFKNGVATLTSDEEKMSTITVEQLLSNGWAKTEGDHSVFHSFHKDLCDPSQEQDPDGCCELVLHNMYNTPMFALMITDGYMININPGSIEELMAFEKMILGVDSPY